MPEWYIRQYQESDAADICRIYNYYVLDTNISFETEPVSVREIAERAEKIRKKSPYFVAELDGRVVGYAYAKPWHSLAAYAHTYESTIYLDHQRDPQICKGLGTALYQKLIEVLREEGYVKVLFGVPTLGNIASERLHEKLGFKKQAVFHDVGFKNNQWLGVTYWVLHF
ncbi:GNAT family N-acetyltransferase [Cardiobacteriaceae bacterium TAE3-ERU3]|nr:GNAT family N-acetyltransferase [Cardiobacteriaceae bacterium TAE3-ERU3]